MTRRPPDPVLTPAQSTVAGLPLDAHIFLEGPAGAGKTTTAVGRLTHVLRSGVPGSAILVLLPQRTLGEPYTELLRRPTTPAGGEVSVLTMGGMARRMVDLYWPLIAEPAGFANPSRPPVFLTLETAQYFMARTVGPLLDQGYFASISVDRNRLYSQILDNLNKAAVVGFPHTEIGARLKAAWTGDSSQAIVYDEAAECGVRFRDDCLAHNLLDFSLQYELFVRQVWPLPAARSHLVERYRHLIADNLEEDTAVAHDVLGEWLKEADSAFLVYDHDGGFRRFLGADPSGAYALKAGCSERHTLLESMVMEPGVAFAAKALRRALQPAPYLPSATDGAEAEEMSFAGLQAAEPRVEPVPAAPDGTAPLALEYETLRYYPEMLDWVADRIAFTVHEEGTPAREIAVLSPFLGGSLRFSLEDRLTARDVPVRSHRPSRALREEPVATCLMTLAALAHPAWRVCPDRQDVAIALSLAIQDLDPVRAHLLAQIVYRTREGRPVLGSFEELDQAMQERLTFLLGGRYEVLRKWLVAYAGGSDPQRRRSRRRRQTGQDETPLDHFLSRLFGEVLSQAGYGFHDRLEVGEVAANLIESAAKFRQVMAEAATPAPVSLGLEYWRMVRDGVVAAQYTRSWQRQPEDAVLLAPAYTFLMGNRPVDHQFWLDVGSPSWWERLYQPLTQPYVLSHNWPVGALWKDADEYLARQEALAALATGLLRRCRKQVHLALADLGVSGYEQRGPLLRAVQHVLVSLGAQRAAAGVG